MFSAHGFLFCPSVRWFLTNRKLLLCLLIIWVCPYYSIQVPLPTFVAQSVLINWTNLQLLPYCNGVVAPFFPARHFCPFTFLSRMLSHSFAPPNQTQPASCTHLFHLPASSIFSLLPLVLQGFFPEKKHSRFFPHFQCFPVLQSKQKATAWLYMHTPVL